MIRSSRFAHLRVLVLVVLALAVISVVVSTRASAYVPEQRYIRAIDARLNQLGVPQDVAAGRVTVSPGPDGIAGYDGTPDGRGAFVFYRRFRFPTPPRTVPAVGYIDEAVYAFTVTRAASNAITRFGGGAYVAPGSVRAAHVSGWVSRILPAWAAAGYENGAGYPLGPERGATAADKQRGCDTVAQYFHRITGGERTIMACSHGGDVRWINV